MSKLFVFLLVVVMMACISSFLFPGPMRRETRLNTFYDRQSPNNNKGSSKPDPSKKKDLSNKWNAQMKSAFTQSSQRTCEDEFKELRYLTILYLHPTSTSSLSPHLSPALTSNYTKHQFGGERL